MTRSDYLMWLGALAIYQVYASVLVWQADCYTESQKTRQIIFIWLVPLLGAVIARMALNAAKKQPRPPGWPNNEQK